MGVALFIAATILTGCDSVTTRLSPVSLPRDGAQPADLVVTNAQVFTSDSNNPSAQAVAVKDRRIVYVGTSAGVSDFVGPNTRVIDAHKKMLTPGFVDSHSHYLWLSALLPWMSNLYDVKDFSTLKNTLIDFAKAHPVQEHPFLLGVGWRYSYLPGKHPTLKLLDEITSHPAFANRPVFLWSNGGQVGWVNSEGLKQIQADDRKKKIFRELGPDMDATTGEPNGVFREYHAFDPFEFFDINPAMEKKMLASMQKEVDQAISFGVTAFNEAEVHERFLDTILRFREQGGLDKIRMRGSLYIGHHILGESGDETALVQKLERWRRFGEKHNDDHFWMGDSVKLYMDGVSTAYNSWMTEPFSDKPDETGHPIWKSMEEFTRIVTTIDRMGIQACTHATGDRAIKEVVNAYASARKNNGPRDSRHRIEHSELPSKEDQERMAALGVHAAMQPAHFFSDEDAERVMGLERMARTHPWASMARAGVELSFGSDWIAGPDNPIYGLLLAGTRLNYRLKTDWGPDEAIDVATALRHFTLGSARALMRDREVGSFEVGKKADLVLFDINLLDITSTWFLLTHELKLGAFDRFVLLTIVDGKIVYKRSGLEL